MVNKLKLQHHHERVRCQRLKGQAVPWKLKLRLFGSVSQVSWISTVPTCTDTMSRVTDALIIVTYPCFRHVTEGLLVTIILVTKSDSVTETSQFFFYLAPRKRYVLDQNITEASTRDIISSVFCSQCPKCQSVSLCTCHAFTPGAIASTFFFGHKSAFGR